MRRSAFPKSRPAADHTANHSAQQKACKQFLEWNGAYVQNNIGGLGVKAGRPDLEGCLQGAFFAVEVKTGTARQTEAQKQHQYEIERAGGFYFLVSGPEALEMQMIEAGFRLVGTLLSEQR